MKTKTARLGRCLSIHVIIACCAYVGLNAQSIAESRIPAPEAEKFAPTDELAVPWRETGCSAEHKPLGSGCYFATGTEYDQTSRLSLFNADGSLWYKFSISIEEPDHFQKQNNRSFSPFSVPGHWAVVLRLVGISQNWYEVEVNEASRDIKYIAKTDASWQKVSGNIGGDRIRVHI